MVAIASRMRSVAARPADRPRTFAKSLTRPGLVDEYQLTTVPIAIGAGRSPFAELEEHLKLHVVYATRNP